MTTEHTNDSTFDGWLAARVFSHQKNTIHCVTCHAADKSECLPKAAQDGQKPAYMFFYDGMDRRHPNAVFNVKPPAAFYATTAGIIPSPDDQSALCAAAAPLAASLYAYTALGTRKYVVCGSGDSPLAREIVDYFHKDDVESDSFIKRHPHASTNQFQEIYAEAAQAARHLGLSHSPEDLCRLTSLALTRHNVGNVTRLLGKDAHIRGTYISEDDRLCRINPQLSLTENFAALSADSIKINGRKPQPAKVFFCSCCDSRANSEHLFCAEPGEFLHSDSISILLPGHDALINGHPHPTWLDLERAKSDGVKNYVVQGHSDCGGIKALIDMKIKGVSYGNYIDPWLRQGAPIVDRVLEFVKKRNLQDQKLILELVTKEVKKHAGRMIASYVGDHTAVRVLYLEIDTRNVQVIDPFASISNTYEEIKASKIKYLAHCPTPENVYTPPFACPTRADGTARHSRLFQSKMHWLFAA